MEKAKVYFCKEITSQNIVKMYKVLGKELPGKVAVKLHSGEKGNQNYLRPEFVKDMIDYVMNSWGYEDFYILGEDYILYQDHTTCYK